jgi:hypothetical protein
MEPDDACARRGCNGDGAGHARGCERSTKNERTKLTFSAPVMVPGATLPAGTYVFRLAPSEVDRHTVQILSDDESRVVATTVAVPAKRQDPKGDTVLKFNPTASGTPALKAWFYPGTLYGREFVYPDAEAREIARRTRTVVLSTDAAGTAMPKGTLRVYDAGGNRSDWKVDAALTRDWQAWHDAHTTGQARVATAPAREQANEATAPMYAANPRGQDVSVDDLEDNGSRYLGKVVSVDAEVERAFGPRVFTIDEPNWSDLDGEVLVYMPSDLAAMIREGDRITVTGTPKAYVRDDLANEWGWPETNADMDNRLGTRPVLVASRIVGGDNDVAMVIRTARGADTPEAVGTSGTATAPSVSGTPTAAAPLTEIDRIAAATPDQVGSQVRLTRTPVAKVAADHGFWIRGGSGDFVFVLPSRLDTALAPGQQVDVRGVVLQMPKTMKEKLSPGGDWNTDVYVYATDVER